MLTKISLNLLQSASMTLLQLDACRMVSRHCLWLRPSCRVSCAAGLHAKGQVGSVYCSDAGMWVFCDCESSVLSVLTSDQCGQGHTWLHDDKMLVGCENGDLLLFDNAGASCWISHQIAQAPLHASVIWEVTDLLVLSKIIRKK